MEKPNQAQIKELMSVGWNTYTRHGQGPEAMDKAIQEVIDTLFTRSAPYDHPRVAWEKKKLRARLGEILWADVVRLFGEGFDKGRE